MDPLELRLKNAAKQGTKAVHGPVYPVMGYQETVKQALAHPHYKAPLGPNQGRGVASGYWFNAGGESSAQMNVNEDGIDRGDDRPSRHRRLARLDGQHRRRAAGHRPQQDPGADRRHQQHRLLQPDRRQPRHLRLGHGGHAVGREGHQDPVRARGQDLEDRARGRDLGQRLCPSGRRQRRQVRAAVAGPDRRQGERDRRPDRRPARRATRPAPRAASARISAMSRSIPIPAARWVTRYTAFQDVGRAIHPDYCRGPDPGRRRPGHRLGAERGVHLQQGRQAR